MKRRTESPCADCKRKSCQHYLNEDHECWNPRSFESVTKALLAKKKEEDEQKKTR